MASRLADLHIDAQARLRQIIVRAVEQAWAGLPGYDEEHVEPFLAAALPAVIAGRRQAAALTDAYVAQFMGRTPIGVGLPEIRNGAVPAEVYRRPFVTVWSALQAGRAWEDAVNAGLSRASASAAMDMQLSSRGAYAAVQEADDGIFGYQRVADGGACPFCRTVNGAYVKSADAMALHNHCGCGLEPLTAPHPRAAKLPSGVAVHEHGELGPLLADPAHEFTSLADI